ncbi:MAG: hypothetical protein ACREBQ_03080 [Nitrososphaerales archaeon]
MLSSEMELQVWQAIERLMPVLDEGLSLATLLFSWKKEPESLTSARETYAWRKAIDMIKESDLQEKCRSLEIEGSVLSLMNSKPIMLRIAGEITNSLIHSYNLRHRIAFFQTASTEPS